LTAHIFVALIVGVSILLMLIRPRNIPEFYWVGGGAILLLVFRLMPLKLAGHAIAKSLDVCFFLTGMMLVSGCERFLLPALSVGLWHRDNSHHLHVE
jgi:arsenical pump membrane protein